MSLVPNAAVAVSPGPVSAADEPKPLSFSPRASFAQGMKKLMDAPEDGVKLQLFRGLAADLYNPQVLPARSTCGGVFHTLLFYASSMVLTLFYFPFFRHERVSEWVGSGWRRKTVILCAIGVTARVGLPPTRVRSATAVRGSYSVGAIFTFARRRNRDGILSLQLSPKVEPLKNKAVRT